MGEGEKTCFFVVGHLDGDDGGASVAGGPSDEVVGVVEGEWVVACADAAVKDEFESVSGLEAERDTVVAALHSLEVVA